jgi:putative flavoprotein involved in K+ transport
MTRPSPNTGPSHPTRSPGAPLDVLVIGGGQAGLTMGYHLTRSGSRYQIVDAGTEIGEAWRLRWDSLRLFTPAQYDNLPELPFPASPDTYPGKDDVADYPQAYAAEFTLPIRLATTVTSLTRGDDVYVAKTGEETVEARQVVIATGPFQTPYVPSVADRLDSDVHQIHSVDYRRPAAVPPGKVLVVGAANSGCQIAAELSATHNVELSAGQRIPTIPQRPFGRDVWWWATRLGLDRVTTDSRLGRRLTGRDQVIGSGPRQLARKLGVRIRPRVTSAADRTVTFADGAAAEFDAVIWATGFVADHSWVDIPEVKDEQGRIQHSRGLTASPGLYLLGMTWQHTRTSALLGWVTVDAAFLADRIASVARRYRQ